MILPNFYEEPLFKDLLAKMQIIRQSSTPQLQITMEPIKPNASIEHVQTPDILEKEPEAAPSWSKSLFNRLTNIILPRRASLTNQSKKEALVEQTKRVSELIAATMEEQTILEEETRKLPYKDNEFHVSTHHNTGSQIIEHLDSRYREILKELLKREIWPKDDFDTLTDSYNLMPLGSIDVLNTWSDEYLGDFILKADSEPYTIDINIRSKFLNSNECLTQKPDINEH